MDIVNNKIATPSTKFEWRRYDLRRVTGRPIVHKEFGEYVEGLRTAKGWEHQMDAARYAAQRGVKVVTRNKLVRLESGKTRNPSAELLRGIARLYEVPYEEVVSVYTRYQFGIDLAIVRDQPRHVRTGQLEPQLEGGGSVVKTHAETGLQQDSRAAVLADTARDVIHRLVNTLAAVGEPIHLEDASTPDVKPPSRGRPRKTGR